jgi:hypothetical protein
VNNITFNFLRGRFEHDRIFSGDEVDASLIAINADPITFNLNFVASGDNDDPTLERTNPFNLAGGGNVVLIQPVAGGLQPMVLATPGVITPNLSVAIMASTLLETANVDIAGLTSSAFFDYIRTYDASVIIARDNTYGRANAASQGDSFRPGFQNIRVDTVSLGTILRTPVYNIIGTGTQDAKRSQAIDTAAVFVNIDQSLNEIVTVTNIEL